MVRRLTTTWPAKIPPLGCLVHQAAGSSSARPLGSQVIQLLMEQWHKGWSETARPPLAEPQEILMPSQSAEIRGCSQVTYRSPFFCARMPTPREPAPSPPGLHPRVPSPQAPISSPRATWQCRMPPGVNAGTLQAVPKHPAPVSPQVAARRGRLTWTTSKSCSPRDPPATGPSSRPSALGRLQAAAPRVQPTIRICRFPVPVAAVPPTRLSRMGSSGDLLWEEAHSPWTSRKSARLYHVLAANFSRT